MTTLDTAHGSRLTRRGVIVGLLCAAAAAHIPVIPAHLREATYMGLLFTAFTFVCLAGAAALVVVDDARLLVLTSATCAAGVLA